MKRALLVIDVQNEYFTGELPVTYPSGNLENIVQAMQAASAYDIPVVVVQHTETADDTPIFKKGSPAWELHTAVAQQPYDWRVEKTLPGSFTGTELEAWLRDRGIDTVVVAGYMTQMCCDTTARQAAHLNFTVEFLSDATGTLAFETEAGRATDEELHRATLVSQSSFFSTVLPTAEWIKRIQE